MQTDQKLPAPKRRPRRNASQWQTLVAHFEESNLTIKDFCEQENLARETFNRWRNKFSLETSLPDFIELQPPAAPSPSTKSWSVEVNLPGGGHLSVRCGL